MTPDQRYAPTDAEWRWVAGARRTHLGLTRRNNDGGDDSVYLERDTRRMRTLCDLGPHESTEFRHVDCASPLECRLCWRAWCRLMRRLTLDDHTRGEVAP